MASFLFFFFLDIFDYNFHVPKICLCQCARVKDYSFVRIYRSLPGSLSIDPANRPSGAIRSAPRYKIYILLLHICFAFLLFSLHISTIRSLFSNVTPRFTTNHEPTTLSPASLSLYHHSQNQHQHQHINIHISIIINIFSPRSAPPQSSLTHPYVVNLLHSAHHH